MTKEEDKLSFWQIVASTLAAALGVQSSKNRKRDFEKGRPIHFIFAGIIFTVVFVIVVVIVVNLVLSKATANRSSQANIVAASHTTASAIVN